MAFRIGRRVFAPGILATVLTMILVVVLASLGRWQLERMREKQALFAAFAAGGAAVHLSMVPPGAARRYQRVAAIGQYDSTHQLLLDNMTHDGRAGFHVLTPLVIDAGRSVLVDRGWVPLGATREQLPEVAVAENERTVVGRLTDLPAAGIELAAAPPSGPWPRLVSYPRMDELVKLLQLPLYPKLLLLDADQPDGFLRAWQPAAFPPERHLGYAITWFALALTLFAIYVLVNLRRVPGAS